MDSKINWSKFFSAERAANLKEIEDFLNKCSKETVVIVLLQQYSAWPDHVLVKYVETVIKKCIPE